MDTTTPSPEYSLTMDQCWALLDTEVVGRVALIVDNHPEIFPVNFVARTAGDCLPHRRRHEAVGRDHGKPVAFEIDGYDARDETAWSVMARGEAEVIESQEEKDDVDALLLEPWQPGEKAYYVRVAPKALTGRRFKVNRPDVWSTRLSDPRRATFE